MRPCLFFFLSLWFSSLGLSSDSVPLDQAQARAVMSSIYDSFINIIPYVYSEKSAKDLYTDKSAQKELIKNLNQIAEYFRAAKHVEYLERPGFRPSLLTTNAFLEETINSIKAQNYVFATSRLKAITEQCVSCHSVLTDAVSKGAFGEAINKLPRTKFDSDYAYANYLFLVRRFTEAVFFFELSIKSHLERPEEGLDEELFSSFRRVLSIYTKVTFNPDKSEDFLKKYASHKNLSSLMKDKIAKWQKDLGAWKKFDPLKIKSIQQFIETYLAPLEKSKEKLAASTGEKDITLLVASGVLTKYLNEHPKSKVTPQILYWLAIAERRLSHTYFFSLSDLYLKDCIVLYGKTPYGKKCFKEYEENIEFGFSGSSGTDIPTDEKKELERLRSYLK